MKYYRKGREIPFESVSGTEGTTKQILIGKEHGPHFALRRFAIEPGGSIPLHTNTVEHEQFVISGRAEVVVGDEKFIAAPGDALLIPADVPHSYRPLGDDAYHFICVVPNLPDTMNLVLKDSI